MSEEWAQILHRALVDLNANTESLAGKLRSLTKRVKALEELVLRLADDGK